MQVSIGSQSLLLYNHLSLFISFSSFMYKCIHGRGSLFLVSIFYVWVHTNHMMVSMPPYMHNILFYFIFIL